MKYPILLLFISIIFQVNAQVLSFILPEDFNHFIYQLQKTLQKKNQNFIIQSSHFNLPQIKSTISRNKSSHFSIYIQKEINPSISYLALFKHIDIFLCSKINQSYLSNDKLSILSNYPFDQKILQKNKITIEFKPEIMWAKPDGCHAY